MDAKNNQTYGNTILASLAAGDLALIEKHLEPVALPVRRRLQSVERRISDVYFVEDGIVSVVATNGRKGKPAEAGIIGREGMTGIELVLADDRSQHEVFVQVAGDGYRLPGTVLIEAIEKSATLRRTLLRFSAAFLIQVTETALANGTSTTDRRLARWLLMVEDRLNSRAVPLTHEFLAVMLCVRRASVTTAIRALAREGLVKNHRGSVIVTNRDGLIEKAGPIYGRSGKELRRLMA